MNSIKQLNQEIGYVAHQSEPVKSQTPPEALKLRKSYQGARKWVEATEVELQRSRIMMVDEKGNMRPLNLYPEH